MIGRQIGACRIVDKLGEGGMGEVYRARETRSDRPGASRANILRARATYEILRSLGCVDVTRVAAHGHSMGAFLTAALVGAYLADFRVASHTAGGVRAGGEGAAPTGLEFHVYPGADHDDVSRSSVVLQRVRAGYAEHGMF